LTQEEKKTWTVDKTLSISYKVKIRGGYGIFALFLLFSFSPIIIALTNGVDFLKSVDPSYLNGIVTACGVLVAFISAGVISKAKELDSFDFQMIKANVLVFVGSVVYLSYTLIVQDSATVLNVILFSMTLIWGSFTAWVIMHTMFRKSRS
jgi:hypothetical protein